MNDLNLILIEGRLVRDAEIKTAQDKTLCVFSLANNRYFTKNGEWAHEVSYIDIEAWGKVAEICGQNGVKGREARVAGSLKQDRWTGNDDKAQSRVKIIADRVEFKPLDGSGDAARYSYGGNY